MNKKDLLTLLACYFVLALLFVEHLCGLEIALENFVIWAIVSAAVHLFILRDYVRIPTNI